MGAPGPKSASGTPGTPSSRTGSQRSKSGRRSDSPSPGQRAKSAHAHSQDCRVALSPPPFFLPPPLLSLPPLPVPSLSPPLSPPRGTSVRGTVVRAPGPCTEEAETRGDPIAPSGPFRRLPHPVHAPPSPTPPPPNCAFLQPEAARRWGCELRPGGGKRGTKRKAGGEGFGFGGRGCTPVCRPSPRGSELYLFTQTPGELC